MGGKAGLIALSGVPGAAFTAMAGTGAAGLKIMRPRARIVSRVAWVLKWKETMTLAGFTAAAPSAGFAATAKCEAVKPQAPCMGAFGNVAQPAGFTVGPRAV